MATIRFQLVVDWHGYVCMHGYVFVRVQVQGRVREMCAFTRETCACECSRTSACLHKCVREGDLYFSSERGSKLNFVCPPPKPQMPVISSRQAL